ncbi:Carbohydrate sulfotransferase 1 [Desmophyllum pertusum]|uniref:Carbohydrate sulfotransferase 1 n=1 Tax=Desmophyllum pertusum TaxID=174260 RepID=A0A9X0CEP1_9CNID|nr:Carbohydrate sulfotransferase 1 [Desmophyllum pertusum]
MTVVKALMGRMPNNSIEQLINVCDSSKEFDCKLLFLVRDPRGIVPSSQAVGFYRDKDKVGLAESRMFSYHNCRQTEFNLNLIRKLPQRWRKRMKILRYEDLAANPSKLLPDLLEFAGLPMDEAASNWLDLASHKPKTESEQRLHRGEKIRLKVQRGGDGKFRRMRSASLNIIAAMS